MSLARLRTFCEVVEASGYSVAALRLHRSQPALSRQVSELEQHFGLKLFDRQGRSIVLTAAGRELFAQSKDLLANAKALEDRARSLAEGAPSLLRVGAHPGLFENMIPGLVSAYAQLRSDIRMDWREGSADELAKRLEAHDLDLAFARYMTSDSLCSQRLFPMHLVVVMPSGHSLSHRKAVAVDDLDNEELLLLMPDSGSRILFDGVWRARGQKPKRPKVEISSARGLIQMASAGQGVAITLSMSCVADPSVRIIPLLHDGNYLGMWSAVMWNRHRELPEHVKGFIDLAAHQLSLQFPGSEFGFPALPEDLP